MSLLDRITALQTFTPDLYRDWIVAGQKVGRLRHEFADQLKAYPEVFEVRDDQVHLVPALETSGTRSGAVEEAARDLVAHGVIRRLREEPYPVKQHWHGEELLRCDRRLATHFGFRAFGVHVNGYVRKADGLYLWVGFRARDKSVAPGKLDNLIAGGQPAGLGLMENLVKEAAEEAGLPEELARQAVPVGVASYLTDWGALGAKDDLMFLYDLELSEEVTPRNTDGEVERFELWRAEEALARAEASDDFKFNVGPVIIDFAIRHGLLTPDSHPDYEALAIGLSRNR